MRYILRYVCGVRFTKRNEARFPEKAMNLRIPDVRILEVHPAPWNSQRDDRQPSRLLPEHNDLGVAPLLAGVADAAKLGYNFLNVAGVEPLRHPGLTLLCREAHRQGMLTSAMAGRSAMTAAQMEWLRFSIDLLGVEIEGRAAGRSRRRCAPRATQCTRQRLAVVRNAGIPFAIVYPMMSSTSLADLKWAAEFASAQEAAMLYLRPAVELTGEAMAMAWVKVESLYELRRGKLVIHFDAVNRYSLRAELPGLATWKQDLERGARQLGEFVSPLVMECDGTVSPLSDGFPRRFAFGNLRQERLAAMAKRWMETQADSFCQVYGTALHKARAADYTYGHWYRMLAQEAQRGEVALQAAG
jgi:hypothetical protein